MAPPAEKKKKLFSSIVENQQQSSGSIVTAFGGQKKKMNNRTLRKIWICTDVWMDILPFFDRPQLGLKLALLSPRFDVLVDKHFDGKSELTIWRQIIIHKHPLTAVRSLSISTASGSYAVPFPLRKNSLPNKIRFKDIMLYYIDHTILAFLRANQQFFGKGTHLVLCVPSFVNTDDPLIWDDFVRQIWPIFAPNIRQLCIFSDFPLENLRRCISPTVLTDHAISAIFSSYLLPDPIADDGPNATAGQVLSKWLHTPTKDGQPKRLSCHKRVYPPKVEWFNNFIEKFLNATTSVHYKIQFTAHPKSPTQIAPFELVNGRTNEKLTLTNASEDKWIQRWIMKRCQNGETAVVRWEWDYEILGDLNRIFINVDGVKCIGYCLRKERSWTKHRNGSKEQKQ